MPGTDAVGRFFDARAPLDIDRLRYASDVCDSARDDAAEAENLEALRHPSTSASGAMR